MASCEGTIKRFSKIAHIYGANHHPDNPAIIILNRHSHRHDRQVIISRLRITDTLLTRTECAANIRMNAGICAHQIRNLRRTFYHHTAGICKIDTVDALSFVRKNSCRMQ
jgi:hypothetical protein